MKTCSLADVKNDAQPLETEGTATILGVVLPMSSVREHMAPRLLEIADLIGIRAALALADTLGGVRFYLPEKPKPEGRLAACIGLDNARVLVRRFGSGELTVPKASTLYRHARDVGIDRAHASGTSPRKLAEHYGLSERRVWEILSTYRARSSAGTWGGDHSQRGRDSPRTAPQAGLRSI